MADHTGEIFFGVAGAFIFVFLLYFCFRVRKDDPGATIQRPWYRRVTQISVRSERVTATGAGQTAGIPLTTFNTEIGGPGGPIPGPSGTHNNQGQSGQGGPFAGPSNSNNNQLQTGGGGTATNGDNQSTQPGSNQSPSAPTNPQTATTSNAITAVNTNPIPSADHAPWLSTFFRRKPPIPLPQSAESRIDLAAAQHAGSIARSRRLWPWG